MIIELAAWMAVVVATACCDCHRDRLCGPRATITGAIRTGLWLFRWRVSKGRVERETGGMQKISLDALARQQMGLAVTAGGGHTADTVFGGHEKVLRQTVVGMVAGARLAEHENPGEATVLVLRGRLRLSVADLSWDAEQGDLLIVPDSRHSVEALENCAFLLTVAKLS